MKILNISVGDYAGVSMKLTEALRENTEHEVRNLSHKRHKFGYPYDIVTLDKSIQCKWIDWADVVNCFGSIKALAKRPKNLIITYIGTYWRHSGKKAYLVAKEFGAKRQVVAGIAEDKRDGLNLDWIPGAIPVDRFLNLKKKNKGKPIFCQSPSNYRRKSTLRIKELLSKNKDIEVRIIFKVPWNECLRLKAETDVYVGSFLKGIGQAEIEAMAMKIPVIAWSPEHIEKATIEKMGYLPYYHCKLEDLTECVPKILDPETYLKYSNLGFNYVRKFHDYPVVAEKYSKIFEEIVRK